ncbi:MAG: segregation and condensation protein A [Parcubacteria group bacterium Gr01-1014_107]|nr:MAG: segregation and condensation protein A [Parcubacteria group bacterium Gr01-1014_107]
MEGAGYKVKVESFEGPLDLLLSLIEERKLFINDISLAKVTDDFVEYIKGVDHFPIALSAQFILIASTLLLIKSKSLLPILELTEEEEGDIETLEKRLEEYRRIKELSQHLHRLFGRALIFGRSQRYFEPVFSPTTEINKRNLLDSLKAVLNDFPVENSKLSKATVKKVLSLEEAIERIIKRIEKSLILNFKEFSSKESTRENIIVSFLALLELFKRGTVELTQEKQFGDIQITNNQQLTTNKTD